MVTSVYMFSVKCMHHVYICVHGLYMKLFMNKVI